MNRRVALCVLLALVGEALWSTAVGYPTAQVYMAVLRIHERLEDDPVCSAYFERVWGVDAAEILDSVRIDVVNLKPGRHGQIKCSNGPILLLDEDLIALGDVRKIERVVLHELAHLADCGEELITTTGSFDEGSIAERMCYGRSIYGGTPGVDWWDEWSANHPAEGE